MIRCPLALASLLLAGCATTQVGAPRTLPAIAIDADFPDPAAIRIADGTTYAYATQGMVAGTMANIQMARSADLARWEHLGDALPVKPIWASRTQDFWAPHVAEVGRRYLLYYSAKPDSALADPEQGLCLAVATADRPEGPFTDSGQPLLCGPGFVNIDPMLFDDPATGKRLLYWGSGFGPIKVQEMRADGLAFAPGSAPVDLVAPVATEDPANYRRLVEGAWMTYRQGWYYLFFSGDNCCGPKAHYATMVARSRSATGPFEVKPGNGGVILEASPGWIAPGHNAVVEREGQSFILYHAVDASNPRSRPEDEAGTRRVMRVARLVWEDGWPTLAD
ncbi:glycoside hydrolase family 43 protein [Erythrobacter sp. WG]|uniref:glycoside hydrolase family 43 protein n=1 Tax=Erythrobacter sp. WG TaxID=2985510 RepID=UPI00227042B7|nr:glycoside hydrolase family 43 protein [Erythrobacter sp. WG]MCX9145815.1 glycoside hydrolase family 43 protein [Erythrobacter sp. WG]